MTAPNMKGIDLRTKSLTSPDALLASQTILTPSALAFLAALHRTFDSTRLTLLEARQVTQKKLDGGDFSSLDFPKETAGIRSEVAWRCASPARGLEDRRVEITGPTERKMVINALNSGASTFMADFEDSTSPTFSNMVVGQHNLYLALRNAIDFSETKSNKSYTLSANPCTLIVRPRGWHLDEPRLLVDGKPMSGSLFDFGLYFFHNASHLLKPDGKMGPYFYLPKMEHYLEARLWNDVFVFSQSLLRIPQGSIRATVLIETLPAAFHMEEILFELREHSSGLNCGRWDYIFSFVKKRRGAGEIAILPDRKDVTMEVGFMDAYVRLLIKTCHKRKVHAMGGMSAQIPIKGDEKKNKEAMDKVRSDKLREVKAGHDGTWIAHPLINLIAKEIFDQHMLGANQLHVLRQDVHVTPSDLTDAKKGVKGAVTEDGVKSNVEALLAYCSAWISGVGCIPINNLMEDAATAEIARVQLWQWAAYSVPLSSSKTKVTPKYIDSIIDELSPKVQSMTPSVKLREGAVELVGGYLKEEVRKERCGDFLTSALMGSLVKFEEAGDGKVNVRSSL